MFIYKHALSLWIKGEKMDKKQAEKRIKELRKVVEYHAKKYYD